jgi:single-strand DNA-binding protein
MAGMNRAIICGRLGRDPESRNLQSGGKVVSFSVATSEAWTDKSGEKQELTEWHNVVIFNEKIGEVAERYLRKGSEVLIEGKIQTRKWMDKEGQERRTTEIVVPRFGGSLHLVGGKANGSGGRTEDGYDDGSNRRPAGRAPLREVSDDGMSDDIPF